MKKGLALAVVLCIVNIVLLCACGAEESFQGDSRPELIIGGAEYAPYFYTDMDSYTGIDVELATEACRRMGYRPVFVSLDLDNRTKALESGEVDCLWSCLTMDGREEEFTWAGPYLYTRRVYVVPQESSIQTVDDLDGKKVSVQAASTSEELVLEGKVPELDNVETFATYQSLGEVFMALRRGYVDAMIGHEGALKIYIEQYPGEYRYLNMNLLRSRLGVAFRRGENEELALQLTQTLQEMTEDGTTASILEKYGLDVERNLYGGTE